MTETRIHVATRDLTQAPTCEPLKAAPHAFHRTIPSYEPTPIVHLPDIARDLGIDQLWVKNESTRIGLPSFKVLGSAWAIHRLLLERANIPLTGSTFSSTRRAADRLRPLTLCTATDGNHGRGVAYMARALGLASVIFVPNDMVPARIEAIAEEGARIVAVPGDYDDAVARAAREAHANGWQVVADVAYEGNVTIPTWVMDGYDTIFAECAAQIPARPTTVCIQAGVGALAGAAIRHYVGIAPSVRFAIIEPLGAACLLESAVADSPVALESSQGSIMAGLNCGRPSLVAWPYVQGYADVFTAIPDSAARSAMRVLAGAGIEAGESGAAGLAGLMETAGIRSVREALRLNESARVLVINTEGATDPLAYREITLPTQSGD